MASLNVKSQDLPSEEKPASQKKMDATEEWIDEAK